MSPFSITGATAPPPPILAEQETESDEWDRSNESDVTEAAGRADFEVGFTSEQVETITDEVFEHFSHGDWECESVRSVADARIFVVGALSQWVRDAAKYASARINGGFREPGLYEAGERALVEAAGI